VHGGAPAQIEGFGRVGAIGRDLQMIGAAEERADLAWRRVGVGRDHAGDLVEADADLQRTARELLERPRSMFVIRLPKRSTRTTWPSMRSSCTVGRGISRRWMLAALRPSAARSTPFASHAAAGAKRSRPSNVRLTVGRRTSARSARRFASADARRARPVSTPVVGSHELVAAGIGGNAAARRTDPGIDDDEKDRADWKIAARRGELERAAEHVVRGDLVRDVDERRVGTNPSTTPFIVPA